MFRLARLATDPGMNLARASVSDAATTELQYLHGGSLLRQTHRYRLDGKCGGLRNLSALVCSQRLAARATLSDHQRQAIPAGNHSPDTQGLLVEAISCKPSGGCRSIA